MDKEVWITGIGLVSCLGEGAQTHWQALSASPATKVDCETWKPYCVHPLPAMDWSKQIPKRGDQRQMENWQRLGVYAAGLALDDAGMKGNEELVSTMDLVVAAGGGERDIAVDENILSESTRRNDRDRLLIEKLPSDLRPTLFLAQLSNLMAGNISIVHRVTGSSRTYMGEESAGIAAIGNGLARIRAGQSSHLLVGGAFNAERIDLLLSLELGHYLHRGPWAPVAQRQTTGGGTITGSVGAFLVLEEAGHARAREARAYGKLSAIASGLGPRDAASTAARMDNLLKEIGARPGMFAISGATGCAGVTSLEYAALARHIGALAPVRALTSMIGNPMEACFPAGVALAALSVANGAFPPPFEAAEAPANGTAAQVLVSMVGHYRGEGFGLVERI